MTAKICFIDTETTSLRHDRRAWEIGIIARDGGKDIEHSWLIEADDLDLGNADVMSLKIGRFYDRHPQYRLDREPELTDCEDEGEALRHIEAITRGAHLVGAVVSFDADVLGQRMRAHGICPSWHYHLVDVEALAVGFLAGSPAYGASPAGSKQRETRDLIAPPWKSDDLSAALGITVTEDERHTALGDAKWARAIYDAVMGRAS
jgi:DNA polymerase III epsilon subunit-like protein